MEPLTKATERLFQPLTFAKTDRVEISFDSDAHRFTFDFFEWRKDGRYPPCARDVHTFCQRLPEAKRIYGAGYRYIVPCTDTSALLIHKLWPRDQIIYRGEDALQMFRYMLLSSIVQQQNIERIANYKLDKTAHGYNGDLRDSKDYPLSPYQKLATVCALNSEAFALHMSTGTGKTPVAINVICNDALRLRKTNSRMYRALIVVPKNVQLNWVDEIAKFKTVDGKVTVLRGTEIDRIRLLLDAMRPTNGELFTAVIVSYETMSRMIDQFSHIEWDLGILDEQHFIASPGAKRTKAALQLRDMCRRRLGLTGTPVRNHALDLYAQLEFLGKGFSGFSSWKTFRDFYGVFEDTRYGQKLLGIQNLPLIRERLARLSYTITKEEALPDLPDKTYDVIGVTLSAEQASAYNQLATTLMLKLESQLATADASSNRQMVVQNMLVQMLRLAQITSGFLVFDEVVTEDGDVVEPKEIQFFSPNPKLDTLVKILKGFDSEDEQYEAKSPDDKTIIWATWTADILAIQSRLEAEGVKCVAYYGGMSDKDREAAIQAFNCDPLVTVFVGNAAAGGVGLNLLGYPPGKPEGYTTNANHVVYYSQNWSQVQRTQSEDRAHRRGTREPVRITDLCVPNSIDEEIRARVVAKKKMALEISDIRSIIKAVLSGVIDDD